MDISGGGSRRKKSISEPLAVLEKSNLRDFLRVRDDDDGRKALAGLTLGAVLGCEEQRPTPASQTVHDIIKYEDSSNKKNWKSFKDRLCRSGTPRASSSSHLDAYLANSRVQISRPFPVPHSIAINAVGPTDTTIATLAEPENTPDSRADIVAEHNSSSLTMAPRLGDAIMAGWEVEGAARESEQEAPNAEAPSPTVVEAEEAPPVRVSLMALLEETDRQEGTLGALVGSGMDDDDEDEDEDDGGGEYVCCVCMVRHKGAAFVPCGHTFCRLCSRELWVSRGNCPLCNGYILEILDIF
ncbi:PREDICTED: uncharacterized protein LOC104609415 [Nelumbo nucifera]|uniref:Uncharacterized protein LOC104609415 n=1 Tax=Nelumbo nucifera TaxID=4432 RepID=A0A1U8B3X2_NELNU|nr:PREDICTED: uncharacterized protein LOC104609415 [Nelumbo nucifera]